jgi:N6-L-threonylcarbamoyladenine synthase/tRNA threonylcarbamoyladenosine biosynthesis protein TsaB
MNILAMETSTQLGGVAVIVNGAVVAEISSLRQKSHSENISPFIAECLRESKLKLGDIDAFAVGQGPGSFTGIRVAANAGKSFSYSFNKPLIALDSLTLLAEQVRGCGQPVLSIINAYKNMVYIGLFDVSGNTPVYIKGPEAIPVRDLGKYISSEVIVVGDGWNFYHPYFSEEVKNNIRRFEYYPDFPQAKTLGLLAEKQILAALSAVVPTTQSSDWQTFRPLYIRASEAEETKRGILITPLT